LSVTLTTAGTDEAAQQQKINESEKDTNLSSDEEVMLETSALLNLLTYAPNKNKEQCVFYDNIQKEIDQFQDSKLIIGGDFNHSF